LFAQLGSFLQDNETLLFALGFISVITFIFSLLFIPWIVVRLPADYFAQSKRASELVRIHNPVISMLLLIAKNMLGLVALLLGILMLVIPGQGLLTIFIGIMLLNFPGKFRLERWLIQRKPVLNSMNWLRIHNGGEELTFD